MVTDEGGPSGKFRRGGAGEGFREYSHHRISDPGTPALIPRKIGGWAGGRTPSTDGPRPPPRLAASPDFRHERRQWDRSEYPANAAAP